MPASRGFLMT